MQQVMRIGDEFVMADEDIKDISHTSTEINNTATATGKDPKENEVKASDDAEVTTVAADPKLTVEKKRSVSVCR